MTKFERVVLVDVTAAGLSKRRVNVTVALSYVFDPRRANSSREV